MRLMFAMALFGGVALYTTMGEKMPPETTFETARGGAKVVHVTPQTRAAEPTWEASTTCNAVLGVIDFVQRKPSRSDSDLARLQANRRAEAEWRADIRQYDKSAGVEARMSAAARETRPDGQWTTDRAWLRRPEASADPISRLRNDDLCVDCAERGSFLTRLERGLQDRCGNRP